MKTDNEYMKYEEERKALYEQDKKRTEEYFAREEEEMKETGLKLDSNAGYEYQQYHIEFLKSLKALKHKYGLTK